MPEPVRVDVSPAGRFYLDFTLPLWDARVASYRASVDDRARGGAARHLLPTGRDLTLSELRTYLDAIEAPVLDHAKMLASCYGSTSWLYYLRLAVLDRFAIKRFPVEIYTLAETLAALNGQDDASLDPQQQPVLNDRVSQHIVEYFVVCDWLMGLEHVRRNAPIGLRFYLTDDSPVPVGRWDQDPGPALRRFGQRCSNHHFRLAETIGTAAALNQELRRDALVHVHRQPQETMIELPSMDMFTGHDRGFLVRCKYLWGYERLNELGRLARAIESCGVGWDSEVLSDLALLLVLVYRAPPPLLTRLLWLGLIEISERDLGDQLFQTAVYRPAVADVLRTFPRWRPPEDWRGLLKRVGTAVTPHLRPLRPGCIVRKRGHVWIIDAENAAKRLVAEIDIPAAEGAAANIRAKDFEERVQHLIDATPWRPIVARDAIGRTLRLGGERITDIDAMAERDGLLLLISCKSRCHSTGRNEAPKPTLSASRNHDAALEDWMKKVQVIAGSRKGDNYDFSSFDAVAGVVCTPAPLYSESIHAPKEVRSGLPMSVSIQGLLEWLTGRKMAWHDHVGETPMPEWSKIEELLGKGDIEGFMRYTDEFEEDAE